MVKSYLYIPGEKQEGEKQEGGKQEGEKQEGVKVSAEQKEQGKEAAAV